MARYVKDSDGTVKDLQKWQADSYTTRAGGDVAVRTTATISGDVTANIEGDFVDDSAFTVGTSSGLAVGGVYTTDTIDSGDFGAFKIDANRQLFVTASDLDVRDLTSASDSVEVLQDTAADLNMTEANSGDILTAVELIDDTIGTIDSAFSGKVNVIGAKAESTVPAEVSDGDAVAQWTDTFGRQILKGTNLSLGTLDVSEVAPAELITQKQTGITQLTETGDTTEINVEDYSIYGYSMTVANVGGAGSTNVIVELQGSIDETNYATLPLDNTAVSNASISNNQMTITTSGTYMIYSSAPVVDVRLNWVTETGGSTATIDPDFFARRK